MDYPQKGMISLADLNWLNEVIELLEERGKLENYPAVYAFNIFFFNPRRLSDGHAPLK